MIVHHDETMISYINYCLQLNKISLLLGGVRGGPQYNKTFYFAKDPLSTLGGPALGG